jgi:transcription elongation factor Elf1
MKIQNATVESNKKKVQIVFDVDNPACPVCKHYNALLVSVFAAADRGTIYFCRDCGERIAVD